MRRIGNFHSFARSVVDFSAQGNGQMQHVQQDVRERWTQIILGYRGA